MSNSVPAAVLAHLKIIATPTFDSFTRAPWLKSPFNDAEWTLVIGKQRIVLNWGVPLGESVLTDKKHKRLLDAFKCWVLAQAHPKVTNGRLHDDGHIYDRVTRVIVNIDYMLLHQESLGLGKHGLAAVTENDFKEMLRAMESASSNVQALYDWQPRLSAWLNSLVLKYRPQLAGALRAKPILRQIDTPRGDWELAPDKRTLIRWRAALWVGGFYQTRGSTDFTHTVNTLKVAAIIYRGTLRGVSAKPLTPELGVGAVERCYREREAVPVSSFGGRPTKQELGYRRRSLKTLLVLDGVCENIPTQALLGALSQGVVDVESLRETSRFATAPFPVIMKNVRNAAEFCYRHGEHIVKSYANVINAAKEAGLSPADLVERYGLRKYLHEDTIAMGVTRFSLGAEAHAASQRHIAMSDVVSQYFTGLRGNRGLVELGRVLIGSVAQNVGPLTARRSAELVGLPVKGVLDERRANIIFRNGKSGVLKIRQVEERPIPKLISDDIRLCELLHSRLGTLETGRLFDAPGALGMRAASKSVFYRCCDTFADYFEVACDARKRRWYVRQHQNRKFLVLAFYYGTTQGNVHTLRWMLAHSDVEHLWHYLTKITPGDMLREVQAYFLVDALQNHPFDLSEIDMHEVVFAELSDSMERRFGTRNFEIIESNMLENFISLSIKKGLEILPHFFEVGGVKLARIAVTIRNGSRL